VQKGKLGPVKSERLRRSALAAIVAAIVVFIDQATKSMALSELSQRERIPLLGDLLGLQLAFNPGATLSFGASATGLLTVFGIAVTVILGIAAARAGTTLAAIGFGFLVGGALGNLIDRLFSPPSFGVGHVTDFLAYGDLFIGNIADIALGVGALLLLSAAWRSREPRHPDPPKPANHLAQETTSL